MSSMYVVFALTAGQQQPSFKAYWDRGRASRDAAGLIESGADTADLYEIENVSEAPTAVAGVKTGNGRFLEAHGRRATPEEEREWFWNVL
jgi:hypothetical protein